MNFRQLYYKLENDYIEPLRWDIEKNSDSLTCFDAWHNMRHLSVSEIFPSMEEIQDDLGSVFKWSDDMEESYIIKCIEDFTEQLSSLIIERERDYIRKV